ncbi:MAG: NPCBM/NEW2 domain-containing protein [Victivallaceae bacterium]|nr:NPCBM/NEW2 domain-containing protein [Victivallaceae bacterium]
MSAVHDEIAMQALSVQTTAVKEQFESYLHEFKESSWYPDYFADRSMSKVKKDKIDPEADRFIYPLPPTDEWHKRLEKLAEACYAYSDAEPLSQVYLISFYLKNAIECLQQGDIKSAIKFCGVYSHLIGDTCEPIHAMSPALLDVIVPPPPEFLGFELHANVEGLKAPVNITGYQPKLLGKNLKQAEMGAFAGLIQSHKFGAAQATPIVQTLYAKDKEKATALSSLAQSESARHFADFIFTVFAIANGDANEQVHHCDLCELPYIGNSVDMLYRYQPIIDASLVPYSGGKMHPLSLQTDIRLANTASNSATIVATEADKANYANNQMQIESVHGFGVVPPLGPPFTDDHIRNADIEFFIVPGAYSEFSATVGLNPLFTESMPSAKFQIMTDGEIVAESVIFKPGDQSQNIVAKIGNARFLTLRMSYVHTPQPEQLTRVSSHLAWVSHGVWRDPCLN